MAKGNSHERTYELYINGETGNDLANGRTPDLAVKTWDRLLELMPFPIVNEQVTIKFLGSEYDARDKVLGGNGPITLSNMATIGNGKITLSGEWTDGYSGSITDADPESDNWCIEDTAALFDSSNVGDVLEFTSGGLNMNCYTICEVLDANTVRLDRPAAYDAGNASAWQVDDTFVLHRRNTIIDGKLAGHRQEYAIGNAESTKYTSAVTTSSPLSIRIEKLVVRGARNESILLKNASVDLLNVLVHESYEEWVLYFVNSKVYGHNCVALAKDSGTDKNGFFFIDCALQASPIGGDSGLKCSLSSYGMLNRGFICMESAYDNSPELSSRSGSIEMYDGAGQVDLLSCYGGTVTIGRGEMRSRCTRILNGGLILSGRSFFNAVGTISGRSNVIDATGNTNGLKVAFGSGFMSIITSGSFTIKNASSAGINVITGSLFNTRLGTLVVDNCAIGLSAEGAILCNETGGLESKNNSGDGVYLKGCHGVLTVNSHDNGGYGLQALNVTQVHNDGSSFADNTSGDTNIDGTSQFA